MKKICFLHTNPEFIRSVKTMLADIHADIPVECLPVPSYDRLVEYAQKAAGKGAPVLVSRGLEACLLKNSTEYPVVDITMTLRDHLELIEKTKEITKKKSPLLAIIGFTGIYDELASLQELMGVRITAYLIRDITDFEIYKDKIKRFVDQAVKDGADCVAGGKIACGRASELGIPNVFTTSSFDSIQAAFRTAGLIARTVEEKEREAAEIRAVINNIFEGIIKIDRGGKIVFANYSAEKLLNVSFSALEGKLLTEVLTLPQKDGDLAEIVRSGKSGRAVLVRHEETALVANFAPIMAETSIEGAVISLEEPQKIEQEYSSLYNNLYASTYLASFTFDGQIARSPAMAAAVRHARVYARYDAPILITGEIGSGKKTLAECIHNAGIRRDAPFAALDCSTMPPAALDRLLYGTADSDGKSAGLLRITNNGTLYLGNLCSLDMYAQQKLAGVLSDNAYFDPAAGMLVPLASRMRLICASRRDIGMLVTRGEFSPALYCALQTLNLHVPPLRERGEDLWDLALHYVASFSSRHKKYVRLGDDVLEVLRRFSWPGNVYQLSKYCERLVVLTEGDLVNAGIAEELLPIWGESSACSESRGPESRYEKITGALKLHGGSRGEAAAELGISKTTLWRWMKQYGIQWQ